jgi:hypothetical protein
MGMTYAKPPSEMKGNTRKGSPVNIYKWPAIFTFHTPMA